MSAFERFTDALRQAGQLVKPYSDNKAVACCPAHDDTHPSLTIGERTDGNGIVVRCHVGCTINDILDALHLSPADLFDTADLKAVYNPDIHYRYPGGRVNHRRVGKKFTQTHSSDHTLYASDRLTTNHHTVLLCEGEKATELAWRLGHPAVATGGAERDCDLTPLKGRAVILVVDRDPAGEKWAARQIRHLEQITDDVKCKQSAVEVDKADLADHFEAGYNVDELVDYHQPDSLLDQRRFDAHWLNSQKFEPLHYHIPGLIPEGFGVLAAPPKAGKSWLVLDLALAAASSGGKALGAIDTGTARPVLYMALEDGKRRLQERCRAIMGDQPLPANLTFVTEAENPAVAMMMIGEYLRQNRRHTPLVIVDTFGRIKPPRAAGADPYQHDYDVASGLKSAADTIPAASLLVVHHTRKQEAADYVAEISGTYGITAAADYIVVLARKRNSPDAILSVTGRDVYEGRYAIETNGAGMWELSGDDLREAAAEAELRTTTANLGDQSFEVLTFVSGRTETQAGDVVEKLGISKRNAYQLLSRLEGSGRIRKVHRGVYGPISGPKGGYEEDEESEESRSPNSSLSSSSSGLHARAREGDTPTQADSFAEPRHQGTAGKEWIIPEGPGRCSTCGFHVATQGHRPECDQP